MVYSADRIPRSEALAAQKRLTALLRYKLKREYFEMCGFVRARISLAIVRSNRHSAATGADGWSGDGTARALVWLDLGR